MASFENKQKISEIEFTSKISNFCPLGKDWYTNQLTVTMAPDKIIPDYVEVDEFLKTLSGKDLIIEDVVDQVFKHIVSNYEPEYLRVESFVDDAVHMPVRVVKTGWD